MGPKVTLTLRDGATRKVTVEDGRRATAAGACPECKADPFPVGGVGQRIESHDTYASDAACLMCKAKVGVLRAVVNTIFGLEEDERVLAGPWKVY